MKKILLLVDVSNLYYTISRNLNGRIDMGALYDFAREFGDGEIWRAIAYGAQMDGEAEAFIYMLRQTGFEPKYKVPNVYVCDGKEERKADWDVGMAVDAIRMLAAVDVVIFATADGDLSPCVEYIQAHGKIVKVVGCRISRELKEICDEFHEIDEKLLWRQKQSVEQSS